MSDTPMTELLPCPFCRGEAETHETIDGWIAACSSEQSELDGFTHNAQAYGTTEAEAIAAWNARAERTCECVAEYAKSPLDGKTIVLHRCSECHELMRPHMRYCPNCGCKVVDA